MKYTNTINRGKNGIPIEITSTNRKKTFSYDSRVIRMKCIPLIRKAILSQLFEEYVT